MDLTLLGTSGAYPTQGDACSGYLVQSKHTNILIDCGSGVFSYLQKIVDFNNLDAVFIRHMHPDHFIDLIAMRYAMRYSEFKDRLNVYVPKSAIRYLHQLSSSLSDTKPFFEQSFNLQEYDQRQYSFGDISIQPFRVEHSVLSHGMKVSHDNKTLVYSSDTKICDSLRHNLHNVDVFLSENALGGGAPIHKPINHLFSSEAGELAESSNVKKLVLTHFWATSDRELCRQEASSEFSGEIIIGEQGLTISI